MQVRISEFLSNFASSESPPQVLYYSNEILSKSLPEWGPYVSLGITIVNVIMTFPPIILIEVCTSTLHHDNWLRRLNFWLSELGVNIFLRFQLWVLLYPLLLLATGSIPDSRRLRALRHSHS
jgi:hypothetical protein